MEGVKQYLNSWWYGDGRKKEYGPLHTKESQRYPGRYRVQKNRKYRQRQEGRNADIRDMNSYRPSTWNRIKGLFDADRRDISSMRDAYQDYKLPLTKSSSLQPSVDRLMTSEKFKKKILERKYEEQLLDQLRRGRPLQRRSRHGIEKKSLNVADEVILLRRKIEELETKLACSREELVITRQKLAFSEEKITLLEDLFGDGNMETEYVKSRRHIPNLQNSERKPELKELPNSPSPVLNINPSFTSSPIRGGIPDYQERNFLGNDKFYEKYPTIPKTAKLGSLSSSRSKNMDKSNEDSLSPVRIDYSKYSGT